MKHVEAVLVEQEGEAVRTLSQRCLEQGFAATSRGLILPYPWYGKLISKVTAAIEKSCQLPFVDLVKKEERKPVSVEEGSLGRIAPLSVSTATSVAVLWRMLEQVSGPVAGMGTALGLFKELLNMIYVDFAEKWNEIGQAPEMALAEQVRQLLSLELHAVQSLKSEVISHQLHQDVQYYAKAMENWAFQIWRQQKQETRRRDQFLKRLELIVKGLDDKKTKRQNFTAWKEYTQRRRHSYKVLAFSSSVQAIEAQGKPYTGKKPKKSLVATLLGQTPTNNGDTNSPATLGLPGPKGESTDPANPRRLTLAPSGTPETSFNSHRSGTSMSSLIPISGKPSPREPPRPYIPFNGDILPVLEPVDVEQVLKPITDKMKQLEDVNGILRAQIAIHRKRLAKLELENSESKAKIRLVEEKELMLLQQLLEAKNEMQAKELEVLRLQAENARLTNRVKLQEHRKWRSAALQSAETLCGMTVNGAPSQTTLAGLTLSFPRPVPTRPTFDRLPNPLDLLRDWGNRCLHELTTMEKGALNQWNNISDFSSEMRDGMVLARLLYYLSLPRYEKGNEGSYLPEASRTALANRQRLLAGDKTQCIPPFPPFQDSFSDIMRQPHVLRFTVLIDFATQLLSGAATNSAAPGRRSSRSGSLSSPFGGQQGPLPTPSYPLSSVVSAVDLADGNRNSIITFLAILYCTFAHPFNHKAESELQEERNEIKGICERVKALTIAGAGGAQMLDPDEAEDQYQILQSLQPPLCSEAHYSLLQGYFWPDSAISSCETMKAFISTIVALQQSMEVHKWHVALATLMPLSVSSALFRDGNRPAIILSDFEWEVAASVHDDVLTPGETNQRRFHRITLDPLRIEPIVQARGEDKSKSGIGLLPGQPTVSSVVIEDVLKVLSRYSADLVRVFMRYSTMSAVRGTRYIAAKEWRQMWAEAGVKLNPEILMLCFAQCQPNIQPDAFGVGAGGGTGAKSLISSMDPSEGTDLLSVDGPDGASHHNSTTLSAGGQALIWRAISNFEMLFDDFVEGVVRVAHRYIPSEQAGLSAHPSTTSERDKAMFLRSISQLSTGLQTKGSPTDETLLPTQGPSSGTRQQPHPCALPQAVTFLITQRLLNVPKPTDFSAVAESLHSNAIRRVIQRRQADLSHVFIAYSRPHRGFTSMDLGDLIKLAKEANWLTHELTPTVLQEIFNTCVAGRDELRLYPHSVILSALETGGAAGGAGGGETDKLMSESDLLHVIFVVSMYKYPSPFVAQAKKFDTFISKNVLEALKARPSTAFSKMFRAGQFPTTQTGGGGLTPATNALTPAPPSRSPVPPGLAPNRRV
jgi:hypothetical protein